MIVTDQDLYPSRAGSTPQIRPRLDPVVYADPARRGQGPLTVEQLDTFESKGFLALPGFLSSAEVAACRSELRRLCQSHRIKSSPEAIVEPEHHELRSLFRVHEVSPFFERVSADERIVLMIQQILDSDVYVHQSRVNLKPGFFGKEFFWHSDFETWHVEDGMPRMRAVSCSILLTSNSICNGPLMLVPGSHKKYVACVGETPADHYKRSLRRQDIGVPDPESLAQLVDEGGLEAPTGPAGSLLLFDCNTMHGSNSNISPYPRSNLFFVYNSVENRVQAPFSGLKPRPEFLASRNGCEPITPMQFDYHVTG